jgi:hypothetical protein
MPMKGITWLILSVILLMPVQLFAQVIQPDSLQGDTAVIVIPIKGKGVVGDSAQPLQNKTIGNQIPGPHGKTDKEHKEQPENKTRAETKPGDSTQLKKHNPKAASWMSAAVPGLGQIYNRKYWKLPIIYVGLGACGYFAWTNTSYYRKYKETYRFRVGVDSTATDFFPNETDNTVLEMKEYYHKNVEISYIAAGVIYLLNIIDATVDAHLYDFDISDDLTLHWEPVMNSSSPGFGGASGTGVKLILKF